MDDSIQWSGSEGCFSPINLLATTILWWWSLFQVVLSIKYSRLSMWQTVSSHYLNRLAKRFTIDNTDHEHYCGTREAINTRPTVTKIKTRLNRIYFEDFQCVEPRHDYRIASALVCWFCDNVRVESPTLGGDQTRQWSAYWMTSMSLARRMERGFIFHRLLQCGLCEKYMLSNDIIPVEILNANYRTANVQHNCFGYTFTGIFISFYINIHVCILNDQQAMSVERRSAN